MSQLDLFQIPPRLTRDEALSLLAPYLGRNLRDISDQLGVTQPSVTPQNSGWVGHTVEWLLGQSPNNNQSPDFGTWELKSLTVRPHPDGHSWRPSGALVLTQFRPQDLAATDFTESHLYAKIHALLLACHEAPETSSHGARLVKLSVYDLADKVRDAVSHEYQELQWAVRSHGVMGLKDVSTRYLGAQSDGKLWRFVARQRWVEEMIR